MLSLGVWQGVGSYHRGECSLMPPGQAQALGLEGPGKCWRVQSYIEARPREEVGSQLRALMAVRW